MLRKIAKKLLLLFFCLCVSTYCWSQDSWEQVAKDEHETLLLTQQSLDSVNLKFDNLTKNYDQLELDYTTLQQTFEIQVQSYQQQLKTTQNELRTWKIVSIGLIVITSLVAGGSIVYACQH